jgi:osmotically-inducible protein OsmY
MKPTLLTLASIGMLGLTALAADQTTAPPDNTAKNDRDRSGETLTPGDQSNSPQDVKITTDIRQAIVNDTSLSMTAKNIKVITVNAEVTLRGPVNTAEEKTKIGQLAQAATNNAKINNQLEVKPSE